LFENAKASAYYLGMALSTAQELAQVQEAIQALTLGGHTSYSIGGRSVSKLSLESLQIRERELIKRLAEESRGSIFSVAKFSRVRP